jgi:DnaK suppressor protein
VSKPKAPAKSAKSAKGAKAATKAIAAAKPAAKKSTAAAKAAAKPAAKPAAKSAAKPAAPKTPAKPVATKPAAKPAAKSAAKPEAGPATKPASKVEATAPAAPVARAAPIARPKPASPPAKPARPADRPVTSAPAQAAPARQSAGAPVLSEAAASAAAPSPSSAAAAQRFTDRFAPAKPAVREVIEVPAKPIRKIDPKLANAWKTKSGRELSEDELLAMPDSEYMNDQQLEFFRTRLQQQKDDLLSNAGETTEHLREDTTIVPDPADRATIEEEHALELRTRDRERKLLKKIAQSLARLDSGDYGYCDETGEPIGLARLLARPTATLSLEAQQRRELKQKMFGD